MGIGNAPLSVRLWSYQPGVELLYIAPYLSDKHIGSLIGDLKYRGGIPGGFLDASFSIDRSLRDAGLDLAPYQGFAVYDTRNGETMFEGVIEDVGKGASSEGQRWQVSVAGTSAHAGDETRPLIYIDRRLDAWDTVQASVSGWTVTIETRDTDDEPSIVFRWPRGTGLPAGNVSCSIMYRPILTAGQRLASFGGTFDCGATDAVDRFFQGIVRVGAGSYVAVEDRGWTTTETSFIASIFTDWSSAHDNMRLRTTWKGASGPTIVTDQNWCRALGVYVRATVFSKDGTEIVTAYSNPYTSPNQVIQDLLGRMLNRYDGVNATVSTSSFQIDQLAYPEGITAAGVLDDMMLFYPDMYWAAWESDPLTNRYRFEWVPWPTTVDLEADISGGYDSSSGDFELYNKVVVYYPDFMGRTKSVTRTQNIEALNVAGVTRSPQPLNLAEDLGSAANAARVGDQFLAEHKTPPNAGTLTIAGPILDLEHGCKLYPWELPRKAPGKLIRVRGITPRADALNPAGRDGVSIFKVVSAEYSGSSGTATLALDSQPRTVQQLLARMGQRRYRKR